MKKIRVKGEALPVIRNTSPTMREIDHSEVAKALGAEPVDGVPAAALGLTRCKKCLYPCNDRHKLEYVGRNGSIGMFRCCQCKEKQERPLTPYELEGVKYKIDKALNLHKISHDFHQKFGHNGAWKLTGYELMEAVEIWAMKQPTVRIVGVDDDYHSNSDLIFIPHEDGDRTMGLTVIFVPQCAGGDPVSFFLYPGHFQELFMTLQAYMPMMLRKDTRYADPFPMTWEPRHENPPCAVADDWCAAHQEYAVKGEAWCRKGPKRKKG